MAIKRLHYFDQQFLVEADFTDEQKYHLEMRRRLSRLLHTFGIAEGLTVRRTGTREVTVDPGTAIDSGGRELVLETPDPKNLNDLTAFPANTPVFITIAYDDKPTDPVTATGVTGNTRVTEAPIVLATTTPPPTDGSVIRLAVFTKTAAGDVPGNPNDLLDGGVRQTTSAKTAPGAITDTNLATGAVTETKLAPGAVTLTKVAANSVDASKIVDGTITATKLAAGSVDATKIVDGVVTLAKLASNSVDATKIVDASVATNELANLAVTSAKLADGAVTTTKLADLNVTGAKLADLAVTGAKLADLAVTGAKLADLAVTDAKIAAGTISEAKLTAALVTKVNTPAGLVSVNSVASPGGNIDLMAANAIQIVPVLGTKQITIGETHSGLTGNVHGLTAAQIGTIGALLSSQYDLRVRKLSTLTYTQAQANGALQTVPLLSFTPKVVLAISTCNALLGPPLGPRSFGGTSVGFFDVSLTGQNQACVGTGVTHNTNSDWFPRTDFLTTGICSAIFGDGSQTRAESLVVSITGAVAGTLTTALTRAAVGANGPLNNFQLVINLFIMGT